MGCDIVVALGQATVLKNTLVGLNLHGPEFDRNELCRFPGKSHVAGEAICFGSLQVPQVRQTCTVLGNQPQDSWGLTHGLNDQRVAAGFCDWHSKLLADGGDGLRGTDLVRLTLERSHSARHALDVLTDLVCRHGGAGTGATATPTDHVFLLADGREAFVVETAGKYWASMEIQQVRAVSDVGLIRQDWRRLAPGLAEFAISQGWWPDDGSKLDFAGSLGAQPARHAWGLKRWGKATVALEQQSGHIDHHFLRQLLGDHFEAAASSRARTVDAEAHLNASFIGVLPAEDEPPLAWCAFGPVMSPIYLPVFLCGDLPAYDWHEAPFAHQAEETSFRVGMEKLQSRVDQEAEDFLATARPLWAKDREQVARLAGALMQTHWEQLEAASRPKSRVMPHALAAR